MGMAIVPLIRSYTTIRRRPLGARYIWYGVCNHCWYHVASSHWDVVLDEMVFHAKVRCPIRRARFRV